MPRKIRVYDAKLYIPHDDDVDGDADEKIYRIQNEAEQFGGSIQFDEDNYVIEEEEY